MKTIALLTTIVACALGTNALESLSGYVGDIPSCAYSVLGKAISEAGCKTTDINAASFDCICKHVGNIAITVSRNVEIHCNADFAQALGSVCGVWELQGTTATDLPAATSMLAAELAGQTPGASATGSSASGPSATGSSGSTAAATSAGSTSKSTNIAVPTQGPGVVRLAGGAAVALAGLMM